MKHKHAELIHAWADGAEIQVQTNDGSWNTLPNPHWTALTYRIKPKEPIVRYACAKFTDYVHLLPEENAYNRHHTSTYWSKCKSGSDNIKATFCPDTGKLLSVEMIKD